MPPISASVSQLAEDLIKHNRVMIFGKSYCPYCKKVKDLFSSLNVEFKTYDLDIVENGAEIQAYLLEKTGQKTVPNVFINQVHVGGSTDTQKLVTDCRLQTLLAGDGDRFEYDLFVIGGGSGGLACSKEAARLGAKVAVADFVTPTPIGTKWGLGGTCVNVGCIPKKLMHQAALLGGAIGDSKHFGWQVPDKVQHDWSTMVAGIQDHIHGLNWGYKVQLRQKNVKYYNSLCKFVDRNTVILTDSKGKEETVTARTFVLAMGGRPYYPDIPGAKEYCITSDDIFSLPYNPGKTLFIGASYIALECAGFLHGLGNDVTVMVRSIFLRGFDQDMANKVAAYMDGHGVKFLKEFVPVKFEKIEEGAPGKILVTYQSTSGGDLLTEVFDSVCLAIGRTPQTGSIGLEKTGVQLNPKTGFVLSDDCDRTNVENIYGIGDVLDGKPELTPVAIQAGKLLARRLYSGSKEKCAYDFVPTTVFTPLEYGACGYSEEKAIETFGEENVEVYHTNFTPLEATVPHHPENECYAKLIVNLADNERVVGFHVLGPNAGEITQGFAIGFKLGATKSHFDDLIGIHPTNAEIFTTLDVTKRSGDSTLKTGC